MTATSFPLPAPHRSFLPAVCAVLAALFSLVLATPAQAAKPFPVDQFSFYLNDYDIELARLAPEVKRTEPEILGDIQAAEAAGNARLAAASTEQLLTRRPTDAALWLDLSRRLAQSAPLNDSDSYALPNKLIGAALRAYELARSPEEAAALDLAAQGFAKREMWRPALTAYTESLKLSENPEKAFVVSRTWKSTARVIASKAATNMLKASIRTDKMAAINKTNNCQAFGSIPQGMSPCQSNTALTNTNKRLNQILFQIFLNMVFVCLILP